MNDFTNDQLTELTNKLNNLLFMLGHATTLILELRKFASFNDEKNIAWFLQAMDNLVYLDKPLPSFKRD